MTIREAKETLKRAGYHTDSIWHIDDVMSRHNVNSIQAYHLLTIALESVLPDTLNTINQTANDFTNGLQEQGE